MKKLIKFVIWIGLIVSLGLSLFMFSNEFPKQYGYIEQLTLDKENHIVINFYKDNKAYVAALDKDLLVSSLYVRSCRGEQYEEHIRAICQKSNVVYMLIDRLEPLTGEMSQYISVVDMNKFWFNKEQHLMDLDHAYEYDVLALEEKGGQEALNVIGKQQSEETSKWQIVRKNYLIGEDHALIEQSSTSYTTSEEVFTYQLFGLQGRVGYLSRQGEIFLSDDQNYLQKTKLQDVDKLNNGILKIIIDTEGNYYALEQNTGIVRRLNLESKTSELVALGEDYIGQGTGVQYKELYNLAYQNETHVLGVTNSGSKEKLIWLNGNKVKQQDELHMTFENKMNYLIQYFIKSYILFAIIAGVVIAIGLVIRNCKYLWIKIVLVGGGLGCLFIFGMSQIIKDHYGTLLENDAKETLQQYYEFYLQAFKDIDLNGLIDGSDHELAKELYETFNTEDALVIYDGELRVGVYNTKPSGYFLDYFLTEEERQQYLQQIDKETPTITESEEVNREYLSLYGMLDTKDNDLKAIIKLNYDKSYINILRDRLELQINFGMGFVIILFIVAFMISLKVLLKPIGEVEKGLDSLTMQQVGQKLKYYTKDDIYRISKMINTLSEKLEHQQYSLEKNSENYFRFAPKGLFEIFHKNHISDLERGDRCSVESSMALISLDWQKVQEKETFIEEDNQLLEIIEDSVKDNKHLINVDNKVLTDFTILLLEEETESFLLTMKLAVQLAASHLLKEDVVVLDYLETEHALIGNDEKWLHMIYSKRKDFLQKHMAMLRKSNCQLILTEEMLSRVKNVGAFHYRYIGFLQQEDMTRIELYDFYEQAPVEIKEMKQRNKALFEKALTTFYKEEFYEARNLFARVIRDDPKDEVARWYIFRCDFIEKAGMDHKGLSLVMM